MNFQKISSIVVSHLLVIALITGCVASKTNSEQTIVSVDNQPVSVEEFLYVFEKNNINQNLEQVTEEDIRSYLDLFVNFKLKVREAETLGLDQDETFQKELEGYRQQLAQPYLTEQKFIDSLVQLTYERLKYEVNASHLLITVPESATPEDTLVAYQRIANIADKIKAGADFNQLASQVSEDPSAVKNKGNLGYFSAMQMVFDFEQAAYSMDLGEVSKPIRTRFGYHLIKLHDKRPSQGRIQISHILVRTNPGISSGDSTMAAQKAMGVYRLATTPDEDWSKLCRQFSEDLSTRQKGGVLPWIKMGDVANIPAFQSAAFALAEVGAISEPVKTEYGWHIIRLENKQELEPFEELEPRIKSSLSRNSRGDLNRKALVKRLRQENQVVEFGEVLKNITVYANDSLVLGNWQAPKNIENGADPILTIESKSFSVSDFLNYVASNQPIRLGQTPAQKLNSAYGQFVEHNLVEYEKEHLSEKYPEYRMLYQEYREGLLLFQLMEEKVWNKAVEDTTGLSNFFSQNQDRYQWEPRVDAEIYSASSEEVLAKVQGFLDKGSFQYQKYDFSGSEESLNRAQIRILDQIGRSLLQGDQRYLVLNYPKTASGKQIRDLLMTHLTNYKVHNRVKETEWDNPGILAYIESTSGKDLQEHLNQRETLALEVQTGRFSRGENDQIDAVAWQPGRYESQQDDRKVLVHIKQVLPAGNQLLSEVKGLVISDYQEELEKQWVQQLKTKYDVVVNEKAVSNVISGYEN